MSNVTYKAMKIFIATPSDLAEERNIFVDIVTEVNQIKGHSAGYHLEPVGWEYTLPGNGRAQSLINEQLLHCDLFIMVLWERWGTPTGEYSSGTEEEYFVALDSYDRCDRPKMWIFFKESIKNNTDIEKIKELRLRIEAERKLKYDTFKDSTGWREKLRYFLCCWIDTLKPCQIANTEQDRFAEENDGIYYEVSYQDWIGSRPEIYFTLKDKNSLENWKRMSSNDKKKFAYDLLSAHLGLILGASPYSAIVRYEKTHQLTILLCTVQRFYEDSFEKSTIYLPNGYNMLCEKTVHQTMFEGHLRHRC